MKKLLCILALWFLVDWVYKTKLKPFIIAEFGNGSGKNKNDSTPVNTDSIGVTANYVYGLDISHNQHKEIDWLKTKIGQFRFVICKATEGLNGTDGEFKNYWPLLKEQGIIKGAYHYYRCGEPPEEQAESFMRFVGNISATDLPPILDFEREDATLKDGRHLTNCINVDENATRRDLLKFLKQLEKITRRRPIIYVNTNDGNSFFTDTSFAAYPLWIATSGVPVLTGKHIPAVWKGNWTFWQKSHEYDFDNNPGNDLDVFNGDMDMLKAFIGSMVIKP